MQVTTRVELGWHAENSNNLPLRSKRGTIQQNH